MSSTIVPCEVVEPVYVSCKIDMLHFFAGGSAGGLWQLTFFIISKTLKQNPTTYHVS